MENTIKQEIVWMHINYNKPQMGIVVNIGGENLYHVAELAKQKGILCWKLFGNQGYADFEKYPYWFYPKAPFNRDSSLQDYITPDSIRSKIRESEGL